MTFLKYVSLRLKTEGNSKLSACKYRNEGNPEQVSSKPGGINDGSKQVFRMPLRIVDS
jgi:hypothetical protein